MARGNARRTGATSGPIGRELHDELVGLRAFDGLDGDAILELGWERLDDEEAARAEAAREIDPNADVATVIDRVKSDQPADFDAALEAYRDAMLRSRAHLIEHDLVTVPDDERIDVIATPEYLRNVIPFAAYFEPAAFDRDPKGIYIVTPSVGGDPDAMREHNFASISNTSIHEAYPGHHLQLDTARRNPSLTRLLTDAPEFTEGWGMYSELMMREHGFDDGPAFRVAMHTDAIWRACRIILDVRMHRGELTIDEATDFLVEHTSFERPNAHAEVQWYTYRPTYPLSYLLGRTLLLALRARRAAAPGRAISLKGFHDALMRNGSLPVSFHRRLLAGSAADGRAGHPVHRPRERPLANRLLAGSLDWKSARRPTGPIGSPSGSSPGSAADPSRRLRGRALGCSGEPRGAWSGRVARRGPSPGRGRRRHRRWDPARVRGRSDPRRADDGDRRPSR